MMLTRVVVVHAAASSTVDFQSHNFSASDERSFLLGAMLTGSVFKDSKSASRRLLRSSPCITEITEPCL